MVTKTQCYLLYLKTYKKQTKIKYKNYIFVCKKKHPPTPKKKIRMQIPAIPTYLLHVCYVLRWVRVKSVLLYISKTLDLFHSQPLKFFYSQKVFDQYGSLCSVHGLQ